MERSERIGFIVSGGLHVGAILWLVLGGIFFSHDMPPPVATAEVSLMSESDFDALQAAAPKADTASPPQPSLPEPPKVSDTKPVSRPDRAKENPAPPEKAPEPAPDAAPDVKELAAPETDVTDEAPTPPAPPAEQSTAELITPAPQPKPADVVAPDPAEAPDEKADLAPEKVTEARPDPDAAPQPAPQEEAAAPRETGDVLKTEENRDKLASAAPQVSSRPRSKPAKPTPAEPVPEPVTAPAEETATETPKTEEAKPARPAPEPKETSTEAVDSALAEALSGEASETPAPGTGTAASGPPMTGGEKDALIVAVKQCWNVGSLSTDALNTVVTIGVSMDSAGKPLADTIHMVGYDGGDDASARLAYEAGRRAIMRCARGGYPLPAEKYNQWKEIEITFDPQKMRMK